MRVHPGSRREHSEQRGDELHVWIKAPPVDGKANARVIEFLALKHGLPRSAVRLVAGHRARTKLFDLDQV